MSTRIEMRISANNYIGNKIKNLVDAMADVRYFLVYSGPAESSKDDHSPWKLIFEKIIEKDV